MKKEKKKTLRNNKKPSKKTYLQKAGQNLLSENDKYKKELIYTQYNQYIEDKNDLYDTIQKEGDDIYISQKSMKTEVYLENIKKIVDSITLLVTSMETRISDVQSKIVRGQHFFMILHEKDVLFNKLKDVKTFVEKLFNSFKNNELYAHLLDTYYYILNNSIKQQSYLETELNKKLSSIEKLVEIVNDDYKNYDKDLEQKETEIITKNNLRDAIDQLKLSNKPQNFVPPPDYVPGCPYGTYLESDSCIFYDISRNKLGDSIIQQKELTNENSDFIVWFKDNNTDLRPRVFKKKPLQYIKELNKIDKKIFKANYVVCDNDGVLVEDKYGSYTFLSSKDCCWNDTIPQIKKMDTPKNGYKEYYIDSDGYPQGIEEKKDVSGNTMIADTISQKVDEELFLAVCLEEDQIVLGIQYIEVNKDGNIIYDDEKHCIPFFPEFLGFTVNDNIVSKGDIKYKIIKTLYASIGPMLDETILTTKKMFNLSEAILTTPTLINSTYLNSYVEFNLLQIYKPFILPYVLQKEGDTILVHNSSDTIPIIFNISKDDNEKRVVVYPKQYYVFIFCKTSPLLNYGFIHLPINFNYKRESTKAAMLNDTYIFVNGEDDPILDSENLLIKVPNLEISPIAGKTSTYYNFDDVFLSTPFKISILPEKIVYNNPIFTLYHSAYRSDNVCKIDNTYVFCNDLGEPNLDIFGYPIPIPYTLEESSGKYLWDINIVNVKKHYDGILRIDPTYISNSLQSGGGSSLNISDYLDVLNPKLQTIQSLINKYGNINPVVNNLAELHIQLSAIIQGLPKASDTKTEFNKGNEIFDKAMDTKKKLEALEKEKLDNDILEKIVSTLKNTYSKNLTELIEYETKIQFNYNKLKDEISYLDENINSTTLKSDLNEINRMILASKNARTLLIDPNTKDTISADQIRIDEKKIEILIQTNKSIESHENALKLSIKKAKAVYDTILINSNKKLKDEIRSEIVNETKNLELLIDDKNKTIESLNTSILNQEEKDYLEDYKKQIELSITNIRNFIENAKKSPNIVQTKEEIREQFNILKLNFTSIQYEKSSIVTNLNKIKNLVSETYNKILISRKNIVDDKITSIENMSIQIKELLNISKLNEDVKENYNQKLNMISTEVKTIQSTIEPIHDPNDLEGYEERIEILLSEEKNILTSLQLDISLQNEQVYKGGYKKEGGKKNYTRKHPKNTIISH